MAISLPPVSSLIYLENSINKDDLKINFTGSTSLKAPVEYGKDLGSLEISLGDEVLKTISFPYFFRYFNLT